MQVNQTDYDRLIAIIHQVHSSCFSLCKMAIGRYLPIAGNIGVFCQSTADFEKFSQIRVEITESSDNPNQKYFRLKQSIIVPVTVDMPETIYTHLYIRKPDPSPYGKYIGDIDFVLPIEEYQRLKTRVMNGEIKGAEMYDRPGWDTIEITNPYIHSVAYISTQEFAEKVRIKFD